MVKKCVAKYEANWCFRRIAKERMEKEVYATSETYRKELDDKILRRVHYTRLGAEPEEIRTIFRVRNKLTSLRKHKEIRHQEGFNTCNCVFDVEDEEHISWCPF